MSEPQPAPTGNGQSITDLVKSQFDGRRESGRKTYGTELRAHNGRDAARDRHEELLDAVLYSAQDMIQRQELIDAARELVENVDRWEAVVGDIIGRDPRAGMCTARLKKALANQGSQAMVTVKPTLGQRILAAWDAPLPWPLALAIYLVFIGWAVVMLWVVR